LVHGLTVVTGNVTDFKSSGVALLNPGQADITADPHFTARETGAMKRIDPLKHTGTRLSITHV
jgi:hypothetical protein